MNGMPRLNVDLPDDLHRRAKAAAALAGLSLKDFVVAAIAVAVKDAEPEKGKR